jgi:hypothetical protein
VVVATPLRTQNELADAVTIALLLTAAALLVFGGLGAWLLAGAALRPVERLRGEVAAISETDPWARVRVPDTGDEIAALAETMNALLARICDGLAGQRRFVADVSHELRTPLANLRTTLELATRRERGREELAEAVRSCEREVIRLGRLVDDVLVLAAADDRVPVDRLPDQPIEPLIQAVVLAAGPAALAREVQLRAECDRGLAVAMHPGLIRQLLDNLLANAIRHTESGTAVWVRASAEAAALTIEVADQGPGFPEGFAEHAFERFRRAGPCSDAPDSRGGGGLGLAVVQAIARTHGGEAAAENGPCGGAVVRVRLPID